jgi:DNA mismatch repair protein MutL
MVHGESAPAIMKIQILSDETASRIAAGEVVERPASVVKELIENSLDAGADEVSVWVEKSGTALIRVVDNGEGMAPDDLAMAVERHSTSKLKEEDDLFHISTLGFRGEALPSIASVSKLEIISRPPAADMGHCLRMEGGKKEAVRVAAAAIGTSVEIRDIFFNTPARRKFLKSLATELSHICDVVNRIALAYPEVHFRLFHDGRMLADYVPARDGTDRVQQVFGRDIAKDLVPLACREGALTLAGYLSKVPASFPNTRYLMTFVNRRYVRDKVVTHAVLQGYESLLMKGQYPAVVLFLGVPYGDVDVNVHPAKFEVRFRRQSEVHEAVARAVRETLRRQAKEPSAKIAAIQPAPGFTVAEGTLHYSARTIVQDSLPQRDEVFQKAEPAAVPAGFFSSMIVLGQILGCYLVCASADGLALIDQHAAHERVTYEKLRREITAGEVVKQNLLIPQTLELSAGELLLLERELPQLARAGFVLEPFGPDCYAVTAVPALLPEGDYRPVVRQWIAELAEVDQSQRFQQPLDERLATMACHSVIRANRKLAMEEMRALLKELDQIEFATQCPHGRPVLVEFSRADLEKMFRRVL